MASSLLNLAKCSLLFHAIQRVNILPGAGKVYCSCCCG
jgi:hypothetical protein